MARFLAKNLNQSEQLPPPPEDLIETDNMPLPLMGRNCIRETKKSDKVNVPLTQEQKNDIETRIKTLLSGYYIPSYQYLKQTKVFRDIENKYGFNKPGIEGRQLSNIVKSIKSRIFLIPISYS